MKLTCNRDSSVEEERVRLLNSQESRTEGRFVLYWMQSAQRSGGNPALDFAIQRANELALPLVVLFVCTPDYPEANLRHYTFMLEGLFETLEELGELGALPLLQTGDPPACALALAQSAAEVVVDMAYLRHLREWRQQLGEGSPCRVWQVETELIVPVELASTKGEYAARTIRPRIHRHLERFLRKPEVQRLSTPATELELTPFLGGEESVAEFLASFEIDRSVGVVSNFFQGGRQRALQQFEDFLETKFSAYDPQRNQPQTDFTSVMSPYLHFGMISPLDLALRLSERGLSEDSNGESFLEELIVRRGLSCNFTHFEPRYDSPDCWPGWARKTLDEHREDERPHLYSLEQLEAAQTHDPYWNAAQIEMLATGYMHNYMRMYWGKKILEWSASAQEAHHHALLLNNKYLLDGRDPASYANIAWLFGVHDRAWQERAIYGKIRCMMANGLERKSDPKAYVAKVEGLSGREIPLKP